MIGKRFLYHLMNRDTEELVALSYLPKAVEDLAMLCVEPAVIRRVRA